MRARTAAGIAGVAQPVRLVREREKQMGDRIVRSQARLVPAKG